MVVKGSRKVFAKFGGGFTCDCAKTRGRCVGTCLYDSGAVATTSLKVRGNNTIQVREAFAVSDYKIFTNSSTLTLLMLLITSMLHLERTTRYDTCEHSVPRR
jgi:hypothetical protein